MPNKEIPESKAIEDMGAAWEAAHAEKPFRDALIKHAEKLTPQEKEKLLWLASEEAEKAIEKFSKKKGEDRERAKEILKKRAMEAIALNLPLKLETMGAREPATKEFLSWALTRIAEPEVDTILKSEWSPAAITRGLQRIQEGLHVGLYEGWTDAGGIRNRAIQKHAIEGALPDQQSINNLGLDMLRGAFLVKLLLNKPEEAFADLEMAIARGPKKGYAGYKDMLPIIERWQVTPDVDIIRSVKTNPREWINRKLEENRFVWDPDAKQYVEM
jgi:hypothetical protein